MDHCTENYKIAPNMFPKQCRTCQKTYEDIREFYSLTTLPTSGEDYVEDSRGTMLFRNCCCGSTLLVWDRSRLYREFQSLRDAL